MRLFIRIFLYTTLVVTVATSFLGYSLISGSFHNSVDTQLQRAVDEYKMLRLTMKTALTDVSPDDDVAIYALSFQLQSLVENDTLLAVLNGEGSEIYSGFPTDYAFKQNISTDDEICTAKTETIDGVFRINVCGTVKKGDITVKLLISKNVQSVIHERNALCKNFLSLYVIVFCVSLVVMFLLALVITRPVKMLTNSVKSVSSGNYSERVSISSNDEIGMLSKHFNTMAEQIEGTIDELKEEARRREEFSMSFAHELKTPLTSVIGYADMILGNELSKDEIKKAAAFIQSEGMRLEALSLKMMELIVFRKQSFTLTEIRFSDCISDLLDTFRPLAEKKDVTIRCEVEDAYVYAEPDLMKTMLINICDNALKAGASRITICGKCEEYLRYSVSICDDGCGIPEKELLKIKEAFYMVDKSRSRKQHGAGLGLAISESIAKAHGTSLSFESECGRGTVVSFKLRYSISNCSEVDEI